MYGDPQICNFSADFSPEQQIYLFNCLQVIAACLTHKSLRRNYVQN